MRRSLALRIGAVLALSVLLSLIAFVLAVNAVASSAIRDLSRANDRGTAVRIAPWIEQYFRERGTVRGIEGVLGRVQHRDMGSMTGPMRRKGYGTPLRGDTMALFSNTGELLVATNLPPTFEGREPPGRNGVVLRGPNGATARLYVGSMLVDRVGPLERQFLQALRIAGAVTFAVVAAAASLLVLIVSRMVVRPIGRIAAATQSVARGDFDLDLDTRREDEIGSLARSFRAMADEIRRQEETRRRFIADSAHELRTPVSLLSTQIEMIRDGVYTPDADQIKRMNGYVERMTRLVSDLGALAALDTADDTNTPLEAVDPGELVVTAHDAFVDQFAAARVDLSVDVTAALPPVNGDRVRLAQVFDNVLSNALRHTPPGSRVTITARSSDRGVRIEIADQGPGIPEEMRERVFDRFYRLDDSRNRAGGGTGLGLAISREIVAAHGGSITIEENAPSGVCVVIYLPTARAAS